MNVILHMLFNTTKNLSPSEFFIIVIIISAQGLGCTWLACGKRPERVHPIKEYSCDNEQECIEALDRAQSLADENCTLVSRCAEGYKDDAKREAACFDSRDNVEVIAKALEHFRCFDKNDMDVCWSFCKNGDTTACIRGCEQDQQKFCNQANIMDENLKQRLNAAREQEAAATGEMLCANICAKMGKECQQTCNLSDPTRECVAECSRMTNQCLRDCRK